MRLEFVGNKKLGGDGKWRRFRGDLQGRRSRHGTVQVTVEFFKLGLYHIYLYGPENSGLAEERIARFPWRIHVIGECPSSEKAQVLNDSNAASCRCKEGSFRPRKEGDFDTGVFAARCRPCADGDMKDTQGDQSCTSCVEVHSKRFGVTDPIRRETEGPGSANRELHDSLDKCGCSAGYVMRHHELTPRRLRKECPVLSNLGEWTAPSRKEQLEDFQSQCCIVNANGEPTVLDVPLGPRTTEVFQSYFSNGQPRDIRAAHNPSDTSNVDDGWKLRSYADASNASCDLSDRTTALLMTSTKAWRCVERACRERYHNQVSLQVETNAASFAECRLCDPKKSRCEASHMQLRQLPVQSGFWRSNEHSLELRVCLPGQACKGDTNRTTLAENLCEDGHWGPLCANCLSGYFHNATGLCQECTSASFLFLGWVIPALSVASFVFLYLLIKLVLSKRFQELRDVLWKACKRRLRQAFGAVSIRTLISIIILPKFKILLGMIQVQIGMVSSFSLVLPIYFMELLSFFSIFGFIDLPLDCLVTFTYRTRARFYAGSLALSFFTLAIVANFLFPRHRTVLNEINFIIVFVFYPSASSIIFGALACETFDDGTRFLRADWRVDCDTSDHEITKLWAYFLIVLIPCGVPAVYFLVILHHRRELNAVHRVQRMIEMNLEDQSSNYDGTGTMKSLPNANAAAFEQKRRRDDARHILEAQVTAWGQTERELAITPQRAAAKEAARRVLQHNINFGRQVIRRLTYREDIDEALGALNGRTGSQSAADVYASENAVLQSPRVARRTRDQQLRNASAGGGLQRPTGEALLQMTPREEAHTLFTRWHPVFGIELDKTKQEPTVARVWPVQFASGNLAVSEEEEAFRGFPCVSSAMP